MFRVGEGSRLFLGVCCLPLFWVKHMAWFCLCLLRSGTTSHCLETLIPKKVPSRGS
ncbi:hypothetical protein BDQ94DRAFT_132106 [Aspergillus welwitschiae]|uniref:Uncharacterized protein n=1 Tax=Aspergillus welwitschiae TaxID=1341132 RepID=A0A3F3QJ48_9EURO|nr:hypothetical protein BDQ94DRAFT_132106 [Aspergillus welwitschiae]RDH38969.1 hypothetical protein BDQ94DRAFT_132106 [Aspergillus welwitschiae]